ncbi:MAG: hypothetical protein AAGA60_19000 [Cyanobacteria bacterium P01_E01_bin.42]
MRCLLSAIAGILFCDRAFYTAIKDNEIASIVKTEGRSLFLVE